MSVQLETTLRQRRAWPGVRKPISIASPVEGRGPRSGEADPPAPAAEPKGKFFLLPTLGQAGKVLLALAVPALALSLWEYSARQGWINPSILPSPSQIWATFLELMKTGELENHVRTSLVRVVEGFSIGATLGVLGGILIGLSPTVDRSLVLVTGLLRPIPIIAWVPVLILWVGIDETSKVTVIAIGSFWPVLLNSIHGIRATDSKFLEVARILGKSKWTILTKVILPSALPSICPNTSKPPWPSRT